MSADYILDSDLGKFRIQVITSERRLLIVIYIGVFNFQLNTLNESGLSPLMLACINNDEQTVRYLLEFGCDIDLETPPPGSQVSFFFVYSVYLLGVVN